MLTKYDAYKLSEPEETLCGEECVHCCKELYKGEDVLYDKDGGVHFCNETCLTEYVRKHPSEFVELIMSQIIEKVEI